MDDLDSSTILVVSFCGEVAMEIILVWIAGWAAAAAINYLCDVLPVDRRFAEVKCAHCSARLGLGQYLWLRACAGCGAKRSVRAWVVQLLFPAAIVAAWLFPPGRLGFWTGSVLLGYFTLVAVIDLEYRLILHPVSWVGAGLGLLIGLSRNSVLDTLLGGAAGFGVMLGFYFLGILFNRVVSRLRKIELDEVALGFGDVNLAGVIGLMLGWPEIIGGLLLAILIGGMVSGLLMVGMALMRRYQALMAIPYGPFLLIGAMIFLFIPKS